MKPDLAMLLIADQMEWDDAEAAEELQYLQLMSAHKYDHYQGFQPGSRFYLALIGWLNQFATIDERKVAYTFLKRKLIFITQREMHHLVSLLMPITDRLFRKAVSDELNIPLFKTWVDLKAKNRVALMRDRTLFIALSDGARIDVFRRYNEGLVSNEQVVATPEISETKWKDLIDNLKDCLKDKGLTSEEPFFERICLMDDFTGSGSSLIRFDQEKNEWKGKIVRFYNQYQLRYSGGIQNRRWPVQVHHHLASAKACEYIERNLKAFEETHPCFCFTPTYSYQLPPDIVINDTSESELVALVKSHYDKSIEDKHTKEDIWFGYLQSGLPLILDHNTPNNSLAVLWAESDLKKSESAHKMKPLFIRRKRHSSHG